MAITLMCKLWRGSEVLDEGCTCNISRIERNPPLTGPIEGEGTITILKMFPLGIRGKGPQQFTLTFDAAIVPHVGNLEKIPIILIPDDLFIHTKAPFKIGEV